MEQFLKDQSGLTTNAMVKITAATYSDDYTQLKVSANTRFAFDKTGADYRLAYVITEDEVDKLNLKFVAGSKKRLLEIFQLLRNASVERVHVESPMTENKDDAKDANDAFSLGDPCDLPF